MRTEIRIAGFGGQGIVLAGYILGKALTLHEGLEAVMTQSYGPEARGGASSANLVVGAEEIDYPFVHQADILVVLSQEAYTKFRPIARSEALVCVDSGLVTPHPEDQPYSLDATSLAEGLGRRIVANVIMLGFLTALTDLVGQPAMEAAIRSTVHSKTIDLNLQAFSVGYAQGVQQALARPPLASVPIETHP